jgi:uncharacterized membrane protein YbaN (DUF454 family)
MHPSTPLSQARRAALVVAGSLCVAVGTVGIVVPGLPTTVFLLVASWCYARSSERLWRKLHADRRLGSYLRMARERALPRRARVASLLGIWGGIAVAVTWGGVHATWLVAVLLGAGLVGTGFVIGTRRRRLAPAALPSARRTPCPTASSSIPTTCPTLPTSARF